MRFRIKYTDEAKLDIQDAKKWYSSQLKGLEKRFGAELKKCLITLADNPYVHAVRYDEDYRIAHTDVFPYSVHYYIDSATSFQIVGIVHNSRDSIIIKNRL
jgi:plasmid stabilization system protein ParE